MWTISNSLQFICTTFTYWTYWITNHPDFECLHWSRCLMVIQERNQYLLCARLFLVKYKGHYRLMRWHFHPFLGRDDIHRRSAKFSNWRTPRGGYAIKTKPTLDGFPRTHQSSTKILHNPNKFSEAFVLQRLHHTEGKSVDFYASDGYEDSHVFLQP